KELLSVLENAVSEVEDMHGRFAHVSGMSFTYLSTNPPGSRIENVRVAGFLKTVYG
ncbi:unnamed protein product, partial [Discosporangium mesarthrocarpum]